MAGIAVAKSIHLFKNQLYPAVEILSELKLPVFVKPNNGGSSIGMSKVSNPVILESAIVNAFKEDDQVLIEEMICGREFTIGVFKSKGKVITLPITEVISDKDFFDYEAKYEGASTEVTPAKIEEDVAEKIREAAAKIYSVFNCRGVVRIDFIYNEENGMPFMLEINTIPGQSEASIIPMQVKAMGWGLKEFYTGLLQDCFDK